MTYKYVTEPCRPYDMGPGRKSPVDLWAIIDRLNTDQLKNLAMCLAIHRADVFEEHLLNFPTVR